MNVSQHTTLQLYGCRVDEMPDASARVLGERTSSGIRLMTVNLGGRDIRLDLVGYPVQLLALLHTMVIATEAAIEEAGGMDAVMGREAVPV